VRKDIVNHLREDQASIATIMVDYYGLPQTGLQAWPGRSQASELAFPEKARSRRTLARKWAPASIRGNSSRMS
jgi:hypothetical protein